jgi:Gpi18-like mannosyltransferase
MVFALRFDAQKISIIVCVFVVAFVLRILLFSFQGYQTDMNTFVSWFNTAANSGPRLFYTNVGWCDYPPFNVYLFWGFGSLARMLGLFGTTFVTYIVKLVPTIFDLLTAGLIYFFIHKQLSFKLSIISVALYVFNPVVIFNAAVWGQFDAIYTLFLLLSLIFALKSKPEFSAVSFAVGILTKPQAIALLPLIVFVIFKKNGVKRLMLSVVTFTATIFAIILPMQWNNPITFLSDIYFGAYSGYAYTSINAFNMWGLFGLWVPDGNLFILGWVMFAAFSLFSLYVLNKRWDKSNSMLTFFVAFMLLFAFFMLPTRIHERYLFPVISILALMVPFVKKTRLFYSVITATFLTNVAYVLYWLNLYIDAGYTYSPNLSGHIVVIVVGIINVIMFLYGSLLLWSEFKGKSMFKTEQTLISQYIEKRGVDHEIQL